MEHVSVKACAEMVAEAGLRFECMLGSRLCEWVLRGRVVKMMLAVHATFGSNIYK